MCLWVTTCYLLFVCCFTFVAQHSPRTSYTGGRTDTTEKKVVRVTYKIDTDSGDVALSVSVVGKTKKKARLSDTAVADQQKLEEVIAMRLKKGSRLSALFVVA